MSVENKIKVAKINEEIYKNPSNILKLSKILIKLKQFYTNHIDIMKNITEHQLAYTIYTIRNEMEVRILQNDLEQNDLEQNDYNNYYYIIRYNE